jgi:hypothetical protein
MKAVSLWSSSYVHQLDHLAVISSCLNIPFIVTEKSMYELTRKYYPFTEVFLVEEENFSLSLLCDNFDLLLISCKCWTYELSIKFEALHKKKMRFCYCPHGNSDKGALKPHEDLLFDQDLSFIYGDHMLDMLEQRGVLSTLQGTIRTGNYRYRYYLDHQKFYDELAEKEIFSLFEKKELSSSFFEALPLLLKDLPKELNILVKLHPYLERDDPARVYHLIGKYEKENNVKFLLQYPLVYPILSKVDAYLGDFSSVGYDFLAFNKPLFFFNTKQRDALFDPGLHLFSCGKVLDLNKNLFEQILAELENEDKTLSEKRKKMYDYTFGKEVCFDEINEQLRSKIASTSYSNKDLLP